MIKIKCGTCGTSQGYMTPSSGELSLPASEEARLVARGVADYVTRPVIGDHDAAATPPDGGDDGGAGENTPDMEVPAEGLEAPGGNGIGHLDEEQLLTMKLVDLKALAEDMGIDTSGLKSKADYAKAIAAVEVEPGELCTKDGEDLPDLGAEDPVI